MAAISITYNGYDLQDANIISSQAQHMGFPDKNISAQSSGRDDDFEITGHYYQQKRIVVEGTIKDTSQANLRSRIDTFKAYMNAQDANLDIGYGSGTRRYQATVESLEIDEQYYNIDFVKYRITFLCHSFGKATTETNKSLDGIIQSTIESDVTIAGSYGPKPTITITVVSETNMVRLKFHNTTIGESIEVEQSFSASDVLAIDCRNQTVKLNGSEVDFAGQFPSFVIGVNNWKLEVSDSGAFEVNVDIDYFSAYL